MDSLPWKKSYVKKKVRKKQKRTEKGKIMPDGIHLAVNCKKRRISFLSNIDE